MRVVGEGVLPSPVRDFAWSPTVDLCLFLTSTQVSAHRLTGQKVWTITSSNLHAQDLEFTDLAWREDGLSPSHHDHPFPLRPDRVLICAFRQSRRDGIG